MRVAIFTDNDFDKVNGVTTTLTAVLDHAPADVSPRIYTASTLGADAPHYLALPSVAVPIPFYAQMQMYVPRYHEYLRRVLADEVEVLHLTTPGPMGLTALWVAAKTGLPLLGSFHTDLAQYTALLSGSKALGSLMTRYLRWVYGRCHQTLVPSAATRELLIASGIRADRVETWPRGVDTTHFTPERRSERLRERWRLSGRDLVLLYVGRVSREKGLEALPEMLYRVRALGVPHRLVVAGDGPYLKVLQAQVPDAVFTGLLTRSDVADVFASADVFLFPSATDTAGNAVLEAQASGVPVVVSGEGGPREQICPGLTGLVCEGNDPRRWAEAIAHLAANQERRQRMGRAAREFALSRGWSQALAPLYQAYRDALRGVPVAAAVHHAA
jgi:glycosyltransferase involved in cell wall biosynthesis